MADEISFACSHQINENTRKGMKTDSYHCLQKVSLLKGFMVSLCKGFQMTIKLFSVPSWQKAVHIFTKPPLVASRVDEDEVT